MRYYLNTETKAVDNLEDDEDPKGSFLEPEKWIPVVVYGEAPAVPAIPAPPAARVQTTLGKIFSRVLAISFGTAILSFGIGLAVLGLQFLAGVAVR